MHPRLVRLLLIVIAASSAGLAPLHAQPQSLAFSEFRESRGRWQEVAAAVMNAENRKELRLQPGGGVIANGADGKTSNLLTRREYSDAEVYLEYLIPENSNSGVYLMGRYEVQVRDSFGVTEPGYSDAGGIYQRWDPARTPRGWEGRAPRVNAARPPGEWQSMSIIFRAPRFDVSGHKTEDARFVQVVHNGVVVQQDVPVTGPTQSATFTDERPAGPLMLQGDHGPVAYRNLRVRALDLRSPPATAEWRPLDLKRDFDLLLGEEVPGARVEDVLEVDENEIRGMYRWKAEGVTPSGLVVSKQRYSSFDVEFEITWGERGFAPRLGEAKNAGFLYHIQGTTPIWPPCLECQGMEGRLGDHFSIRGVNCHQLTLEGKWVEVPRREFSHGPRQLGADRAGWNTVRVEVRGTAARYFVNGQRVNEIRQAVFGGQPCKEGFIGFQAEHAEVTYRNLRIRVLPAGVE